MIDRFDKLGNLITPAPADAATSMLRMDGSVYFANGNVGFETDGSGWFGDRSTGNAITFANGAMTFGNGIKINLTSGIVGLKETLESFANMLTFFIPVRNDGTPTQWGAGDMVSIKVTKNFYSTGEVSAFGFQEGSATGTGGVGINVSELAQYLSQNGYATQSWVEGKGYITSADLTPYLTSKDAQNLYQPKGNYLTSSALTPYLKSEEAAKLYQPKGDYALTSVLSAHVGNSTVHITATERNAWNAKLNASVFNELFEKVTVDGKTAIKAKYPFFSEDEIAAYGFEAGNGGGTGGVGINASELAQYLSQNGYATRSWVEGKQYLTGITKAQVEGVLTGNITSHSHSQYLASSSYTAADVLAKIKGVDGTGSGLDADMLDGLHSSSFYATKHLFSKDNYQHYVVLLWQVNKNGFHRINGKLYTESSGGAYRYQAADIDLWFSRWSTGTNFQTNFRLDTFGVGANWRLVTCAYDGELWYALQNTNTQATGAYFIGTSTGIDFTSIHYYTSNNNTIINSEINGSIVDKTSELIKPSIGSNSYALISDNVASANQLKSSHTLWGQSFNGTGNVTGSLSSVGNVSPSADNTYNLGSASVGFKYGYMRWIGAPTGAVFQLGANNGNHMYIGTDGKVGIGTTSPAFKLDVNGETCIRNAQLRIGDCARQLIFRNDGSNTYLMYSDAVNGSFNALRPLVVNNSSGNIGLGNGALNITHGGSVTVGINLIVNNTLTVGGTNSNGALEIYHSTPYIDFHFGRSTADYTTRIIEYASGSLRVEGNLYTTGELTALTTSDLLLKRNVRPVDDPLRMLRALGGYRVFDYRPQAGVRDSRQRVGLIYQAVSGMIGERMRLLRPDGYGALNYNCPDYINLIGASVLQVDDEIKRLKKRIEKLEKLKEAV